MAVLLPQEELAEAVRRAAQGHRVDGHHRLEGGEQERQDLEQQSEQQGDRDSGLSEGVAELGRTDEQPRLQCTKKRRTMDASGSCTFGPHHGRRSGKPAAGPQQAAENSSREHEHARANSTEGTGKPRLTAGDDGRLDVVAGHPEQHEESCKQWWPRGNPASLKSRTARAMLMQAVADSKQASSMRHHSQPRVGEPAFESCTGLSPGMKRQRWCFDEVSGRWHCNAPNLTAGMRCTGGDGEDWWRVVEYLMEIDIDAASDERKHHALHAQVQVFALDGSGSECDDEATDNLEGSGEKRQPDECAGHQRPQRVGRLREGPS